MAAMGANVASQLLVEVNRAFTGRLSGTNVAVGTGVDANAKDALTNRRRRSAATITKREDRNLPRNGREREMIMIPR